MLKGNENVTQCHTNHCTTLGHANGYIDLAFVSRHLNPDEPAPGYRSATQAPTIPLKVLRLLEDLLKNLIAIHRRIPVFGEEDDEIHLEFGLDIGALSGASPLVSLATTARTAR